MKELAVSVERENKIFYKKKDATRFWYIREQGWTNAYYNPIWALKRLISFWQLWRIKLVVPTSISHSSLNVFSGFFTYRRSSIERNPKSSKRGMNFTNPRLPPSFISRAVKNSSMEGYSQSNEMSSWLRGRMAGGTAGGGMAGTAGGRVGVIAAGTWCRFDNPLLFKKLASCPRATWASMGAMRDGLRSPIKFGVGLLDFPFAVLALCRPASAMSGSSGWNWEKAGVRGGMVSVTPSVLLY